MVSYPRRHFYDNVYVRAVSFLLSHWSVCILYHVLCIFTFVWLLASVKLCFLTFYSFSVRLISIFVAFFKTRKIHNIQLHPLWTVHIPVMQVTKVFLGRVTSRNMNTAIVQSVHICVMCVTDPSVDSVHWTNIYADTQGSVFVVVCVINHSMHRVIWIYISVYIAESAHILVLCVVNLSVFGVILLHINAYTAGSGHMSVMCVRSPFVIWVTWKNIKFCTLGSVHIRAICVRNHSVNWVPWTYTNASILERPHIHVTCVINHLAVGVV